MATIAYGMTEPTFLAGADLTGKQRLFVKGGAADPQTVTVAGAGEAACGVLDLAVPTASGQACAVNRRGVVPVIAGSALTKGQLVTPDASGRAVVATALDYVVGTVWQAAGALGEIALVLLSVDPAPAQLLPVTHGTVAIDLGSMTTLTAVTATGTITGAKAGDRVLLEAPAALEAGIIPISAHITADNTVTLTAFNATAGTVNPASATFTYTLFDLT